MYTKLFRLLLYGGALFYIIEGVFHFFGLPILEHDKIFLPTHDRYIALYAFTYAALLILITTDLMKYRALFVIVMIGILLSMFNGWWIAHTGGYSKYFSVKELDQGVGWIGIGALGWYSLTWLFWILEWRHLKRTIKT